MFRARNKSMLELALCDAGINAKVGLGKQIIDMIAEHGNWQVAGALYSFEKVYVVFDGGKDAQNVSNLIIRCSFINTSPLHHKDWWLFQAVRAHINDSSIQEWDVDIWDFKDCRRIQRIVRSEYDLTGKRLSGV